MKAIISILLILFIRINGFAQQYIDMVNAPLNRLDILKIEIN